MRCLLKSNAGMPRIGRRDMGKGRYGLRKLSTQGIIMYWGNVLAGRTISAPVFDTTDGNMGVWHLGPGLGDATVFGNRQGRRQCDLRRRRDHRPMPPLRSGPPKFHYHSERGAVQHDLDHHLVGIGSWSTPLPISGRRLLPKATIRIVYIAIPRRMSPFSA